MLVTVVRSYSPEAVELPDGLVLKPFKFVEYTSLPDSMKPSADGKDPGGLQKLVDAGLVKVAQIQDIGHLMVEGSAENRLPVSVTGVYVPAAGAITPDEQKRIEERDKDKSDNLTENSKVSVMSDAEVEASAPYRASTDDLMAPALSITQKSRGYVDDGKSAQVKMAADADDTAPVQAGAPAAAPVKPTVTIQPVKPTGPATA